MAECRMGPIDIGIISVCEFIIVVAFRCFALLCVVLRCVALLCVAFNCFSLLFIAFNCFQFPIVAALACAFRNPFANVAYDFIGQLVF